MALMDILFMFMLGNGYLLPRKYFVKVYFPLLSQEMNTCYLGTAASSSLDKTTTNYCFNEVIGHWNALHSILLSSPLSQR